MKAEKNETHFSSIYFREAIQIQTLQRNSLALVLIDFPRPSISHLFEKKEEWKPFVPFL